MKIPTAQRGLQRELVAAQHHDVDIGMKAGLAADEQVDRPTACDSPREGRLGEQRRDLVDRQRRAPSQFAAHGQEYVEQALGALRRRLDPPAKLSPSRRGASTEVVQSATIHRAVACDHRKDEMPARKTKRKGAADTGTKVRAEELAAADSAAAATASEAAVGAADVTRGEDEAAAAATFSALSDAAARRGARDAAEGAAALSMADEVAAGGERAAALSTDEFRRGMDLAGIAGQVQVAAELLQGVRQPTLAAFLGRTSQQLRVLAVDALSRATEGAIVAHGAEHLAGELTEFGLTEMGEGRDEYATSEALGAASAEMAAAAVRSAAAVATELAAAKAMGGMAQAVANDGADRAAGAPRAGQGPRGRTAPAATSRSPKRATRAAPKRAARKPSKPKK